MITLSTLGSIDLRDASGRPIQHVLVQPKPLALLVYLAVAEPRGFHRRDKLVALFWRELDGAHARAALRAAVHRLRASLGDDVIISRGTEEIALAEDKLRCDVCVFDRLLREQQPQQALSLYRGHFLEGLYVPEATAELEHWVADVRERVRTAAVAGC